MEKDRSTWRFPRSFWTGNVAELCERAAYYGTFIALRTYLIRVVGLDDIQAGTVAGFFGGWIYLLPFFTGAIADRIGFRPALITAFTLLGLGYGTLGAFNTLGPVLAGLGLIIIGGAFVKPVITGTVAKSSDEFNRVRAFSIFYMVVNIGSFTGKTIVAPMREHMGVATVPWFSTASAIVALLFVFLFFNPPETESSARPRDALETLRGMLMVLRNGRFLSLIVITAGFWAIQGQLYASMPDYVLRMAGEHYHPEWYANINPLVVVIFVVAITHLVRKWKPEQSIGVAMALIPVSSLLLASSSWFSGPVVIFGINVHPITLMMVIGIAVQGLAECFLSPKYLEFASKQAPPGKEGVFLGFAHINTFFAWMFGFIFSGFMLKKYCPEPSSLSPYLQNAHQLWLDGKGPMPEIYSHAQYLWYAYTVIGILSFLGLLLFIGITRRIDRKKIAAEDRALH